MRNFNRLKILRGIVCLGLVSGILFSLELWFPFTRTFPRAPFIFSLPETIVFSFERLFTAFLIGSLILTIINFRPKVFSITALLSLLILIFFDWTRLQPWVYQYLLLLSLLTLHDWQTSDETASTQTLSFVQIMIAGLYFWSGVQKLNFTFSHETLPLLLTPLQNLFPTFQIPFVALGISIALTEALIGCGLLFRKTRNLSVALVVAMHVFILTLLIAKNYNSIVWVWNAALAVMVLTVFWRSDVSIRAPFDDCKSSGRKTKLAITLTILSIFLPVLSFLGIWDVYLSGALYSGNVEVAVIRVRKDSFEKLPPKARAVVFQTKSKGEQILPLFEWSLLELNVPIYPEKRVFREVFRDICRLKTDQDQFELIVKNRPAIFDGSYQLTRINCGEFELEKK